MNNTSKVQEELLAATGLELPEDLEEERDRIKFYAKLARKASTLTDDEWVKISIPAQTWVDDCIEALKESPRKAIPKFPDVHHFKQAPKDEDEIPEEPEEIETSEEVAEVIEEEPEEITPAPVVGMIPSYSPKNRVSQPGTSEFFRGLIIDNPTLDIRSLADMSKKKGHEIPLGSASTIFYQTHCTLKLLYKKGILMYSNDKT